MEKHFSSLQYMKKLYHLVYNRDEYNIFMCDGTVLSYLMCDPLPYAHVARYFNPINNNESQLNHHHILKYHTNLTQEIFYSSIHGLQKNLLNILDTFSDNQLESKCLPKYAKNVEICGRKGVFWLIWSKTRIPSKRKGVKLA